MNDFIDIEALVENLPGHVYWLDRNNVYQGCNDLQARALGLHSRHEIVGKQNKDFEIITAETAEIWDKNNYEVMQSQVAKIYEEPSILEPGIKAVVLSHKKPIIDNKGNVIGILGISIDVSEKVEIEKKLKEKDYNLDLALENIIANLPGHIYWLDRNNIFLGCNELQAKSAGLKSRHDVVGKTNHDMPWREHADDLNAVNSEVMRTGIEYSIEEKARLSNGKEAYFLSKKVPLFDNQSNIVGLMGISFDITERKKMEQVIKTAKEAAEAANKAKTSFLENMKHDIRTPLSGIVGYSELLSNEKNAAKINEYTFLLAESSKELLRFLNEILESVNIATGEIPLLKKRFNLKNVVESLIKLHLPKASKEDLKLEFFFDETIPKYLLGDPVRIYRIILELLANALKFTKQGYVRVSCVLSKINERDLIIKLEVEDSGMGISLENQQELFVRFKRLTPSYQGIYKGSGLGLSIVKQFIDDLQGEIDVHSHLGEGTRFICLVPLKRSLIEEISEDEAVFFKEPSSLLQRQLTTKQWK